MLGYELDDELLNDKDMNFSPCRVRATRHLVTNRYARTIIPAGTTGPLLDVLRNGMIVCLLGQVCFVPKGSKFVEVLP